jgi:toxin ParE1/3/4
MVAPGRLPFEFHPEAEDELLAAGRWYADRSEAAAMKLFESIKHAVDLICESPATWPMYLHSTRKYVVSAFPYLIVYRDLPHIVQIVAVAHTRRKPGYWKDRIASD